MARNKLAGKRTGTSKTAKHYAKNAKSRAKKKKYDTAYSAKSSAKKKRVETNKANRKAKTYGNGDRLDASHSRKGKIRMEAQSKNRARNGSVKGKSKTAKRKSTKR
jgi:division protein CdvB (Snf7/Vps24/ESCRT-III family)